MNTDLLFSSYPFISGDRVTLTRITELDLEALWDIWGDEENYRFWPTAALPAPAECTRQLRQADQRFREKRSVLLGIYPNGAGQTLAGVLKLYGIDPRVEALSLQVMVAQKHQGRGYGSGAVEAAAQYLFQRVGARRLQAFVLPIDKAGAMTLERCGFVKEGTLREAFLWPDKGLVDLTLYSLLRSDRKQKTSTAQYYL